MPHCLCQGMVRAWRAWLFGLALLTACTVERAAGEFGAGVCDDGNDNDDDDAIDCRDPDCQAEAVCGRAASLSEPDDDPGPATSDASAPEPTLPDPTLPVPPPRELPDAEVEPPPAEPDPNTTPDAGALDEPRPCEPECVEGQSCIMGYCVPNVAVFAEVWEVVSVSVAMPRADTEGSCLDPQTCLVSSPFSVSFPACRCAADPVVHILIKRPDDDEPMRTSETDFVRQQDSAEWTQVTKRELLLRPEYEIVLRALDQDGLGAELVFECSVPAAPDLLAAGTLSCGKTFKGAGAFARSFDATIAIEVRPATQ
jgi:hypothetical protein